MSSIQSIKKWCWGTYNISKLLFWENKINNKVSNSAKQPHSTIGHMLMICMQGLRIFENTCKMVEFPNVCMINNLMPIHVSCYTWYNGATLAWLWGTVECILTTALYIIVKKYYMKRIHNCLLAIRPTLEFWIKALTYNVPFIGTSRWSFPSMTSLNSV